MFKKIINVSPRCLENIINLCNKKTRLRNRKQACSFSNQYFEIITISEQAKRVQFKALPRIAVVVAMLGICCIKMVRRIELMTRTRKPETTLSPV